MMRSRVTLATIDAAAMAALRVSPSTTALCGGASGPSRNPSTRHTSACGARSARTSRSPFEVRAMQPVPIDVAGGDDPHGHVRRSVEDGAEQHLAHLGVDLLRIVQECERAGAVAAAAMRSRRALLRPRAALPASPSPPRRHPRRSERRGDGRTGEAAVRSEIPSLPRISLEPERVRAGFVSP